MTVLQTIVARWQAHLGDGESAWKLRNYYYTGSSCRGAKATANYWGEMAAENGHVPAQKTLVSDTEKDFILSRAGKIPWMEKAAAKGWQGAEAALGRMRKLDADWKSRPSLSFSLLEASAEAGFPDAQYKAVVEAEAMFAAGRDDMLEWMEKAEKKGWKGAADALKRMRARDYWLNPKSLQTSKQPDLTQLRK